MPLRVGIVGLGFMGKTHFDVYGQMRSAKVTAICDVDPRKRQGDWSASSGNIGAGGKKQDLTGIATYSRIDRMLADADIDVVDVTLPTHLHADATVSALRAGKHVICEKPMARNSAQCRKMIAAANKAGRKLFVGQCIRFWPEYAAARKIVQGGRYGRVASAVFTRLSPLPTWSYKGWLLDVRKSGGAALDLHIHDADFILHLFGKPRSVTSSASGPRRGHMEHVVTCYRYGANQVISAEGGWAFPATFPFSMSFRIVMDKATLAFGAEGLMLYPVRGQARPVKVATGDGYQHELKHFIDCIAKDKDSDVLTPASAMQSVRLIEAEMQSALKGAPVKPRL